MSNSALQLSVPGIDADRLVERFLRYVAIDTRAVPDAPTYPSNPNERVLGQLLVEELKALGLSDAVLDEHGYVMATLAGNRPAPLIGFIAHLDTAAETPGADVKPLIRRNYQGEPLRFPGNPDLVLSLETSPALATAIGQDLITTDGTTLLGGDDKAGIAIIMAALEALVAHPEWPHGDLRIAFTPDEELGEGTRYFDIPRFGARYAYTVDGEAAAEFNDETFNASGATLTITGLNVHPGKAKGVMVNAIQVLGDFLAMLPRDLTPQETEGREGFVHPTEVQGGVEAASLRLIVRDFDLEGLAAKERLLLEAVLALRERHPRAQIELELTPSYRNMRSYLDEAPQVTELALQALVEAGLTPERVPLRGGTDGSALSCRGVLTPNLFTGSGNHHGLTEWASIQQMTQAAEVVVRLARLWTGV
ncbi:MAG TPA: peptidase T [Stenomitos sp.]